MVLDITDNQFDFPEGKTWLDKMRGWGNGGPAVSIDAFPWGGDFLELNFQSRFELFKIREDFVGEFGFAVPNAEFINDLTKLGPILEIGSGTGYLAHLLLTAGVDIIATDAGQEGYEFSCGHWGNVIKMEAHEALLKFQERTILLAWPCLGEPWGAEALKLMKSNQEIVFIGEGMGGCTADSKFFEILNQEFEKIQKLTWRAFPCIHDKAIHYRKA